MPQLERHWCASASELLDTEVLYLFTLKIAVHKYAKPLWYGLVRSSALASSDDAPIPEVEHVRQESIDAVFQNIDALESLSSCFLAQIVMSKGKAWPRSPCHRRHPLWRYATLPLCACLCVV